MRSRSASSPASSDLIPNIGATIAGFILTFVIYAEEGLTKALIMLTVVLSTSRSRTTC